MTHTHTKLEVSLNIVKYQMVKQPPSVIHSPSAPSCARRGKREGENPELHTSPSSQFQEDVATRTEMDLQRALYSMERS